MQPPASNQDINFQMLISEQNEELRKNLDTGVFNDDDFITRNDSVLESSAFGEKNHRNTNQILSGRDQPMPVNLLQSNYSTEKTEAMNVFDHMRGPSTPLSQFQNTETGFAQTFGSTAPMLYPGQALATSKQFNPHQTQHHSPSRKAATESFLGKSLGRSKPGKNRSLKQSQRNFVSNWPVGTTTKFKPSKKVSLLLQKTDPLHQDNLQLQPDVSYGHGNSQFLGKFQHQNDSEMGSQNNAMTAVSEAFTNTSLTQSNAMARANASRMTDDERSELQMTWLSRKNQLHERRIQNLQERLQQKNMAFNRPLTGQPNRAIASRRNIRVITDQRDLSKTQEQVYSEVDTRSGVHTIRTEKVMQDVTRTAPKPKSMPKYKIEFRGEIAKKALLFKPRLLSAQTQQPRMFSSKRNSKARNTTKWYERPTTPNSRADKKQSSQLSSNSKGRILPLAKNSIQSSQHPMHRRFNINSQSMADRAFSSASSNAQKGMIFTANNSLKYTSSQMSNPKRPEKRFNVRNLARNLNQNSGSYLDQNFQSKDKEEHTISSKCPNPKETSTTSDHQFRNSQNTIGKGGIEILNTSSDQQQEGGLLKEKSADELIKYGSITQHLEDASAEYKPNMMTFLDNSEELMNNTRSIQQPSQETETRHVRIQSDPQHIQPKSKLLDKHQEQKRNSVVEIQKRSNLRDKSRSSSKNTHGQPSVEPKQNQRDNHILIKSTLNPYSLGQTSQKKFHKKCQCAVQEKKRDFDLRDVRSSNILSSNQSFSKNDQRMAPKYTFQEDNIIKPGGCFGINDIQGFHSLQKKFQKEGIDVKLKKSKSVNPVIMVKQFANIMNEIKSLKENQIKVNTAKDRAALRKQHKSVSVNALRRDMRKIKVVPKLQVCDQCKNQNAVMNSSTRRSRSKSPPQREVIKVSSLPKRIRIQSNSSEREPGSVKGAKTPERTTAPLNDYFPVTHYESLKPQRSNKVFSKQRSNTKDLVETSLGTPSSQSHRKQPLKSFRSNRSAASVWHGSTFHRSFNIERDLTKYSKNLNYVTTERMLQGFTNSALGRRLTALKARQKIIGKLSSKWDKEREAIKNVDWFDSELYQMFKRSRAERLDLNKLIQERAKFDSKARQNADLDPVTPENQTPQRQKSLKNAKSSNEEADTKAEIEKDHQAQKNLTNQPRHIFTDLELDYSINLIKRQARSQKEEQTSAAEFRDKIVLTYFNRCLYTLRELTRLLQLDFHYDRLFKRYEHSYTVETVLQLMSRCRKMYSCIEMMQTIFKLLDKLRALQDQLLPSNKTFEQLEALQQKEKLLKQRVRGTIKSFLAQHTLFPIQFRFDGVDQLSQLKDPVKVAQPEDDNRIIDIRSPKSFGKMRKSRTQKRTKSKANSRRSSMGLSESKSQISNISKFNRTTKIKSDKK